MDLIDCPDDARVEDVGVATAPEEVLLVEAVVLEVVDLAVVPLIPSALVEIALVEEDDVDEAAVADEVEAVLTAVALDEVLDADVVLTEATLEDEADAEAPFLDVEDELVEAPPAYTLGLKELLLGLPSYLLP